MKKILLITHHDFGDPGIISKILHKRYFISTVNYKNLKNIKSNDINSYSTFIFFGGKMSANSKSINISYEYNFISNLIRLNKNILGICLGAQMIAQIFGSKVNHSKSKQIEVGYRKILPIDKKLFRSNMSFLQFHNEGISKNSSMEVIANGRIFDVDAYKIKDQNIFGLQFHPEVTEYMIKNWYNNLKNKKAKGIDKLENILKDHKKYNNVNYSWMENFLNTAFYD